MCITSAASSGSWHAGLEVQQVDLTFKPRYTPTNGQSSQQFTDRASGQGLAVSGDYMIDLADSFGLAIQIMASYDNAEWALRTDEVATLKYGMPWRYGASLLPEWRFKKKLAAFIEFGVEQGRVEQEKESEVASTYSNTQWVTGAVVGGGLRYDPTEALGVFLSYRFTQFQRYRFFSRLSNGTIPEIIQDAPYSGIISFGFSARV